MKKALKRLRSFDDGTLIACGNGKYVPDTKHGKIADQIEAMLSEQYLELPKDVNGAPIHVGDMLVGENGTTLRHVIGVSEKEFFFNDHEAQHIKKNRAHCWKLFRNEVAEAAFGEMLEELLRSCDGSGNVNRSDIIRVFAKYSRDSAKGD